LYFIEIEKAGFRSWPALEELETDGIVLRFSNGYTKRANSVNLLKEKISGFDSIVSRYEQYFQDKKLPCIFRLTSFSENKRLDCYLEEAGYRYLDRSLVLERSIENTSFKEVCFPEITSREWMKSFCKVSELSFDEHLTHLEMIDRIKDKTLFAVLVEDGVEVACGLGVVTNGLFGLFDIATRKSVRNRGYGIKLIEGMLHWAVKNGASSSYLQVVASNKPAIRLYEKMEYQHSYEYWYRIRNQG
jgi:GNAT superfamily N-acetyltransferase